MRQGKRQRHETRGNRLGEGTGQRGRGTLKVANFGICVNLGWACWTWKQRKFDEEYLPNGYFVGVIKCKFDVILCMSHIQLTILPEDDNKLSTI